MESWSRGEGGDRTTSPLLQLVWGWLGARRSSRRWPSWARCARPFPRLLHPRCARWWGMLFGSPKPSGGNIDVAAFLLAAEDLRQHC